MWYICMLVMGIILVLVLLVVILVIDFFVLKGVYRMDMVVLVGFDVVN